MKLSKICAAQMHFFAACLFFLIISFLFVPFAMAADTGVLREEPAEKAKKPPRKEVRPKTIADVMNSFMGKPITSVPIVSDPVRFPAYQGYELWRWDKANGTCYQELFVDSKNRVAGWWHNCPELTFGDLGTLPKETPIPDAIIRPMSDEALRARRR